MGFLKKALSLDSSSLFGIPGGSSTFGLLGDIGQEPINAAHAQKAKAIEAQELQKKFFNILRDDAEPLRELRNSHLNKLINLQGLKDGSPNRASFYSSPEYRQVRESASDIDPSAPSFARNALLERADGVASGEFGNFYNRLATTGGFSSKGLNSTNSQLQSNLDAQTQLLNDAGVASASGLIGSANQKSQAAGSVVGGLAAFFSDKRLKTDIKKVGKTDDGLTVYTYRYKDDPDGKVHMGVMAQEVEKEQPEAFFEMEGVKGVDYERLS